MEGCIEDIMDGIESIVASIGDIVGVMAVVMSMDRLVPLCA